MKTFTEISGIQLKDAFHIRAEILRLKMEERRSPSKPKETPKDPVDNMGVTPVALKPSEEITLPETQDPVDEKKILSPEERLAALEMKKAEDLKKQREDYQALLAGIREPLAAKFKEKYGWTDEKMPFYLHALEVIDPRKLSDLRRVVIFKPDKPEEVLPNMSRKIEEHVYLAEYFPPKGQTGEPRRDSRGDRNSSKKKGGRSFRDKDKNFSQSNKRGPQSQKPPQPNPPGKPNAS